MSRAIEPATGQPIAIEKPPTAADPRNRRLGLTRAALRESLLEDDLDT
jgi:ATP-dependent RNA helicase DeaD